MVKIAILRRKELGNNCHFVADAFKELFNKVVPICQPLEVPPEAEFIIRWGTTTNLPNKAAKVINKAKAIHETSDKSTFRKKAENAGLAPRIWRTLDAFLADPFVCMDGVVIRPLKHERSKDIYFGVYEEDIRAEVKKLERKHGAGNYYISEYIKKDREIRVFMAQGRVILVLEKKPKRKGDISWGCVDDGFFQYVRWSEWPLAAVEVAIKAFNLSDLDFGAVDLMIKDGKGYALEVNTAPEVWPYFGECLARALNYMIVHDRKRLPIKDYKNWKNIIHPAMTEKDQKVQGD